jgi:hypothetical protein
MLAYNKFQATQLFSDKGVNLYNDIYTRGENKKQFLSDKYQRVESLEVLHALGDRVPSLRVQEATITGRRGKGSIHLLRAPIGDAITIVDTVVQPEIVMRNSFGGESGLTLNLGFFRQVCANGLIVGSSLIPAVELRHVRGGKFDREMLQFYGNVTALADADIKGLIENNLTGTLLAPKESALVVARLPVSDAVKKAAQVKILEGNTRIEDSQGQGYSAWNIWNIVNETARIAARNPQGVALATREAKLMDAVLEQFKQVA